MFTRLKVTLYVYTTNFFYKLARTRTYAYIYYYIWYVHNKKYNYVFKVSYEDKINQNYLIITSYYLYNIVISN